ncbi:MAG: phage tail tape measure protein, partial [Cyanobacteria bacterium J06559_3]
MVDTELKIKVNADTASIGGIKGVERAIQKVNAETEKANRLAGLLAQEYKLSDKEAAQVAAELKRVQAETSKAKQEAQGLSGVFQGIAQGIGQQLTQVAVQGFQAAIASVANTLRQAITEFEAFETALTEFDAKSDATAEQIGRIGEQAKELAAVTSQTPASVAALSTALLTLGATASDVETNLAGITKLSDVLGEDPVLTGRVVQTGINNFEELGESADSIADKLNTLINTTAAGSAQGIEEFFQFFQDVGPLAGTLDADFDQLAAGFSTLRDGGFSAATAATGLRISLLRLSAPSGEAEELLGGLADKIDGVDNLAFNADGSFRGFEETIRNFAAATQDLNNQEQLELAKKIFGDEGAPAILALLGQVDGKYADSLLK